MCCFVVGPFWSFAWSDLGDRSTVSCDESIEDLPAENGADTTRNGRHVEPCRSGRTRPVNFRKSSSDEYHLAAHHLCCVADSAFQEYVVNQAKERVHGLEAQLHQGEWRQLSASLYDTARADLLDCPMRPRPQPKKADKLKNAKTKSSGKSSNISKRTSTRSRTS